MRVLRKTAGVAAVAGLAVAGSTLLGAGPQGPITIELTDYLEAPMTGAVDGLSNQGSLARINMLREEPGNRGRFFLSDLNGPLYIVDKGTKFFEPYLDFNGADGKPGLFKRFTYLGGFATGLIAFQFDPSYVTSGKFYTIHMEDPTIDAPLVPDTTSVPRLNILSYEPTQAIPTPGEVQKEVVLVEWTDTNTMDNIFEGTARELMRVQVNTHIHPMGDMAFNPMSQTGDGEWGVMYIGSGDGGAGERTDDLVRHNPQRLDTAVGKILRIIPNPYLHPTTSRLSANGRYRIPNDNPFTDIPGALGEIYAVGLRNPHRLTWVVDGHASHDRLLAHNIGLHAWETIDVIRRGANYGYSEREGNQRLTRDNETADLPTKDEIPWRFGSPGMLGSVTPTYPVVQYAHDEDGGDAIAGGFLYTGSALPELQGKYIFGDISTGRLWWADYDAMLAADDGDPQTMAERHLLRVRPAGVEDDTMVTDSTWAIVMEAYHDRGGTDEDLPGSATVSGAGRVDMRLAQDAEGELYVISKSDGMVRKITAAVAQP